MSRVQPSENGQIKEKLNMLQHKVVIDDSKLKKSTEMPKKLPTLEFHQKNKKMICRSKLNILKKDIQITKLSQILEAELITKEKDLNGFWNNYSSEISKKLWLPQQTDLAD